MPINFHAKQEKTALEKEIIKVEAITQTEGFSQIKKVLFDLLLIYVRNASATRWGKFKPSDERYALVNRIFNGWCKSNGSQLDDLLYTQYVLNQLELIPDSVKSDLKVAKRGEVSLYDMVLYYRDHLIAPIVTARKNAAEKWFLAAGVLGVLWLIVKPWAGESLIISPQNCLLLGSLGSAVMSVGNQKELAIADLQTQLAEARRILLVGYRENNLYTQTLRETTETAAPNIPPLQEPSAPVLK